MDIYKLKLHEDGIISDNLFITRVPGGWIYETRYDLPDGYAWNSVFVPFNNEFQK